MRVSTELNFDADTNRCYLVWEETLLSTSVNRATGFTEFVIFHDVCNKKPPNYKVLKTKAQHISIFDELNDS